jgi:sulfate adenylyltransferase subunit 1
MHTPKPSITTQRALRFLTAGSVDDGKSTLIGRLLLDSRAILADQLEALERRAAGAPIDLSLLTDGLEAEREQGITIDVAYRYFATKKRKFIIADAPGHEQYTRNMVTAAAGSDAAVVLVDITKIDWRTAPVQLLPQTRRHALLAHLLRVPSIVFAVNKLDAVASDHAQAAFEATRDALRTFCAEAGITVAGIVPVSALTGANVATSAHWPWYRSTSLLALLETLPAADVGAAGTGDASLALPVQYVSRDEAPNAGGAAAGLGQQARTFWGRIAQGQVRPGDAVQIFPSGQIAVVAELRRAGAAVRQAASGESAGLVLDRQLDVSRGDWIMAAGANAGANAGQRQFSATLAWLDIEQATIGRKYWLRHGHRWVQGRLTAIDHRLDIHTLQREASTGLAVNDIGQVRFELQEPLPLQPYALDRIGGALIVVDPSTHRTSGALMVAANEDLQ